MLRTIADVVVRVCLAPACPGCGTPLERPLGHPVCDACWRAISPVTPPWCAQCGEPMAACRDRSDRCARCRRTPPHFALARSIGQYEGVLREFVHALKYDGRRALAVPLAALMRERGGEALDGADAVVPVPLHPWRAFRRGFNQSDDLALHVGLPVWRPLRRTRLGVPQAGLPASGRHANVRRAFDLRGAHIRLGAGWRARLARRTVVLIDDVMTTGATLDECGRVLIEAGVRNVRALTLARAAAGPRAPRLPPPRPSTAPR
jgi:ComF family protein